VIRVVCARTGHQPRHVTGIVVLRIVWNTTFLYTSSAVATKSYFSTRGSDRRATPKLPRLPVNQFWDAENSTPAIPFWKAQQQSRLRHHRRASRSFKKHAIFFKRHLVDLFHLFQRQVLISRIVFQSLMQFRDVLHVRSTSPHARCSSSIGPLLLPRWLFRFGYLVGAEKADQRLVHVYGQLCLSCSIRVVRKIA